MKATTKKLLDDANKAIDKLNGDTSVSAKETLSALRGVRDHLDMLIDALDQSDDVEEE